MFCFFCFFLFDEFPEMQIGAAQDTNSLDTALRLCQRPSPDLITYGGVFNETLIKAHKTDLLEDLFCSAGHDARNGKLYLGMEIVSSMDGKPRDESLFLDLVVTIDTSGSMSSQLSADEKRSKILAAGNMVRKLIGQLRPDDSIAVNTFCETSIILLPPTKICNVDLTIDIFSGTNASGCENVPVGLNDAFAVARQMKRPGRQCRVLFFSDMSVGEVDRVCKSIQEISVKGAKEGIAVTYIGLGQDFNASLSEKITIASGSSYFSIVSEQDFEDRIAKAQGASLVQCVSNLTVKLTAKNHKIVAVFGAGKEGFFEEPDTSCWTRDTAHLECKQTQEAVAVLKTQFPSDVVGLIVDRQMADSRRPICLISEQSVFPSPPSKKVGYQKGGWVLVELDGPAEGVVRLQLDYIDMSGKSGHVRKEVDLAFALKGSEDSEGFEHALVLKSFVDQVKSVCGDKTKFAIDEDFYSWFKIQDARFQLDSQREKLDSINVVLKKLAQVK
jgi:Mg-chelatase subunit ChlD